MKKENICILGVNGIGGTYCHDSSAAILRDGVVIAACEQERFSRNKHAFGEAPNDAILYCLEKANMRLDDIDRIGWNYITKAIIPVEISGKHKDYEQRLFPKSVFRYDKLPPIHFIDHHVTHIASAFYQSVFKDAACLIVDGQGDCESITTARATLDNIEIINTYGINYSLGWLFNAASKFCGFGWNAPGKVMGLAQYGKPDQAIPIFYNPEKDSFSLSLDNMREDKSGFLYLSNLYVEHFKKHNYPFKEGSEIDTMSYVNFAASVQATLEEILVKLVSRLAKSVESENLVMCGGVALNCSANAAVEARGAFKNVFVHPGAHDAGSSIGAALELYRRMGFFKDKLPERINSMYYGPEYNESRIDSAFKNAGLVPVSCAFEELYRRIASKLHEHKIVGWFQDGCEFGPRALGARSILGNPTKRENFVRLNKLKKREMFRPLGPSILENHYSNVFDDCSPHNLADFMLKTVKVKQNWVTRVPAIVHIDGTSRPQIVRKTSNEKFYRLISSYHRISYVPLVINTSFNVQGQPIVNTPEEAIEVFINNDLMDVLVIGNRYIEK